MNTDELSFPDPAFALKDTEKGTLRTGKDGCLAVFDTMNQAKLAARKTDGAEVVPVYVLSGKRFSSVSQKDDTIAHLDCELKLADSRLKTILDWCEGNIKSQSQIAPFCVQVRDLVERATVCCQYHKDGGDTCAGCWDY